VWLFLHSRYENLSGISPSSHADLTNAKKNWNKTAGYTEVETTAFKNILELPDDPDANKFVDIWRNMHPEDQQYTYFSYRFNCRVKGIGWRLDMCMCTSLFKLESVEPILFYPIVVLSERLSDRAKMVK
jgi:exonuclease III